MPQSVPAGLTGENVLKTLFELDAGLTHPFGNVTGDRVYTGVWLDLMLGKALAGIVEA
jgi:hypothetical protein